MRTIKQVIQSQKVNMGGNILDQPLPVRGLDQIDPFLLVHHWEDVLPGQQTQQEVGVGPHPHRGFAPVTFIFKGGVHHRDSMGRSDIIHAGGTQWMNSGNGIIHSERPYKELAAEGGDFELIQFWVNAPAARKMDPPNYQPLSLENTPQVLSEDGKIHIGVVAGELEGVEGPIDTYSPLLILRLEMAAGGKKKIPLPSHYNAFLYLLDGEATINGTEAITGRQLVYFNNDGNEIEIEALATGRAILLSGQPIAEPVATYGPFVMNTEQEIVTAIQDFQTGKMGQLNEIFE